jgi:hypothetical protein
VKLNWKVAAAFTGIFMAGAVTGTFVGVPLMHRFAPRPVMVDQLKKFTEQLDLSPEQRDKIKPILKQTAEELRKTRRDAFKATTGILERMEASISKELTDAQRVRFAEMQAQERERRKQWMSEKSKPRGDSVRPPGSNGDEPPRGPSPDRPAPPPAAMP